MKIGILAVQGDFEAHAAMLRTLGAETTEVRTVADLESCDGLVLPGGESTTQLQFLQEEGLQDAICKFAEDGYAIFGTCAGAILLATEVKNPSQASLGLMDMTVLRNAYGRQVASDVFFGPSKLKSEPMEMVFIRGPIIDESYGPRRICRQTSPRAKRELARRDLPSGTYDRHHRPRTFSSNGGKP